MFESFAESPADAAKREFKEAFPETDPEMMYQIEAWRRFTALRRLEVPVEVNDLVPTAEQVIFVENSVKKIIGDFLAYIRYARERKEEEYL